MKVVVGHIMMVKSATGQIATSELCATKSSNNISHRKARQSYQAGYVKNLKPSSTVRNLGTKCGDHQDGFCCEKMAWGLGT